MPKLPRPPSARTIAEVPPAIKTLRQGTALARIYFSAGRYPTAWNRFRHFGPTNSRFDHQRPDAKGQPWVQPLSVLYCATHAITCLAEVFQQTRRIDRIRDAPWLVVFKLQRSLRLLDLSGAYPTRVGASMAINSASRVRAREWARCFHAAYPDLHGIFYASSMHANLGAIVLNERAQALDALGVHPEFNRALADDALLDMLKHAAVSVGYGLR